MQAGLGVCLSSLALTVYYQFTVESCQPSNAKQRGCCIALSKELGQPFMGWMDE